MDEAHRLCDRVAIMHQGKILDCAPPADLIARHIAKQEVEEEIRAGVRWRRPPNLEDVYLKLTGSRLEDGVGGPSHGRFKEAGEAGVPPVGGTVGPTLEDGVGGPSHGRIKEAGEAGVPPVGGTVGPTLKDTAE